MEEEHDFTSYLLKHNDEKGYMLIITYSLKILATVHIQRLGSFGH